MTLVFPTGPETNAKARIYAAAIQLFAERGADSVTVRDLANAAGIARGTIYNNIADPDALFGHVANALAEEMISRTYATIKGVASPLERTSIGIRIFIRRAHAEPDWGRFLVRFGPEHAELRMLTTGPAGRDIREAVELGLFNIDPAGIATFVSMLKGSTLAAMSAVIQGEQRWRDAGTYTVEFLLRAGGVPLKQARKIARIELPPLTDATLAPARTRSKEATRRGRH